MSAVRRTSEVGGPSGSGRGSRDAGRLVRSTATSALISSLAVISRLQDLRVVGEVGVAEDQPVAGLVGADRVVGLQRLVHLGEPLGPDGGLADGGAGLGDLLGEADAVAGLGGGLAADPVVQRRGLLGQVQRLGVGRPLGTVGQAAGDLEHVGRQVGPEVVEGRHLPEPVVDLLGRLQGLGVGRAPAGELADLGQARETRARGTFLCRG